MPVMQWMYFDSLECLPEEEKAFSENSYQKVKTRYDGQIAVFGQDFQRHILSRKYFIVSALRFCSVFVLFVCGLITINTCLQNESVWKFFNISR